MQLSTRQRTQALMQNIEIDFIGIISFYILPPTMHKRTHFESILMHKANLLPCMTNHIISS